MSLKEALERDQLRQAEAAKREDYYRRMLNEAGMQGGGREYRETLPVELRPEYQALIDEFVELCPSKAWKTMPEKPDESRARCF